MKRKNLLKFLSVITTTSVAIPFVIACSLSQDKLRKSSKKPNTTTPLSYDVGLTTAPLNSLNYIKNKNTARVTPTFVEGFLKDGPNETIKNSLGLPIIKAGFETLDVESLDDYTPPNNNSLGNRFYPMDTYGVTVGVAAPTVEENTILGLNSTAGKSFSVKIRANEGQSTWSNGDQVTPQDFIDSAQYILDINTGSQILMDFLNLNIKNAQKIVDVQNAYVKKHQRAYVDPFGRKEKVTNKDDKVSVQEIDYYQEGNWESQNPNDDQEVQAIKEAVLGLGIYTGDFGPYELKDIPESADKLNTFLKTPINRYADPRQIWSIDNRNKIVGNNKVYATTKWEIRYEFEESSPINFFKFLYDLQHNYLRPVNRKFIESEKVGGIHYFGVSKDTFIWNGAFDLDIAELGQQGYLLLTKRDGYYSSGRTLVNVIKIFFQTQETVTAALFDDGKIAQTKIATNYIYHFWSDRSTRKLMNKQAGYGTIALQLNLDSETSKVKALQDSDFRNALWYAINRQDVLRLVGWDTSFVVTNWTAFGQAKTSKGIPIEQWFDGVRIEAKDGKTYPLQSLSYQDHLAKNFTFENIERTDNNYNLDTAKYYLGLYKKKNPNVNKVKLEFVYDSSEEQLKASIAIQDLFKKAFDGFVEVNIKGYPANVYEQFRSEGKFDITYGNFDSYGSDYDSYIKTFFYPDGIEKENQKTTGFRLNPSGDFTYKTYFDNLKSKNSTKKTRTRLKIPIKHWEKIEELSYLQNVKGTLETLQEQKERVNRFFSFLFTDAEKEQGWTEEEVFAMTTSYEKIIRDAAPIIPLMEIDTNWEINRLGGVRSTFSFSLQYAYDYKYPPRPDLPTSPES